MRSSFLLPPDHTLGECCSRGVPAGSALFPGEKAVFLAEKGAQSPGGKSCRNVGPGRDNGCMVAGTARDAPVSQTVQVTLLGQFSIAARGRVVSEWPRPSARRLCELILVSPGRRISRDLACEELFPRLEPRAAARALSKALSMARSA